MSMLFDVSLSVRLGEARIALAFTSLSAVTALVGPSGIGKTTILNMIAGIRRPGRGHVRIAGQTLFDSDEGIDLPPARRRCGYVFQDNRLFAHLNVRHNLLYGHRLAPPGQRWADPAEVIALLGLGAILDRWPASLSGGEAKRVAIGRALLSGPAFLLMDEPLTSLDPGRRDAMLGAVESIRDLYHLPILYVSHQQNEVERIAETVIEMPLP